MTAVSPTSPTRVSGRVRPIRLLVMVVVGVAVLLGLGGVGVAVNLYDEATAIDRGEPHEVVANYLDAIFAHPNDIRATSLECKQDERLEPIREYRGDVDRLEEGFGIEIDVFWTIVAESEGSTRQVTVDLTRETSGGDRAPQTWQFDMVDEDGWKVCGAQRIG